MLSIDGGRGTLAPVLELKIIYRLRYRIRYRVRYGGRCKKTVFVHSILIRYRRKTFDIGYDIQFRRSLYTRYVFDIEVFIKYRVQYRITITGYKDIEGKNFDVIHDIGAMSGYTDMMMPRYRRFLFDIKDMVDIGYYMSYLGRVGAPATPALHWQPRARRRVQPPGP